MPTGARRVCERSGLNMETQFEIQRRGAETMQGTIAGGECGIPRNTFKYPVVNLTPKLSWQTTIDTFAP